MNQFVSGITDYGERDWAKDVEFRWSQLRQINDHHADEKMGRRSKFADTEWDYREVMRYRINFGNCLANLGNKETFPFSLLLKLIARELLGSEAQLDRAPRSVLNIIAASKELVTWMGRKGVLVSEVEGGYFGLPRDISTDEFAQFFRSLCERKLHDNTRLEKVRLLKEWWHLSQQKDKLPEFLKLPSDPFCGMKLSDFEPEANADTPIDNTDDEDSGWLPIPLETAFPLAQKACEWLEKYADPLITLHGILESQKNRAGAVARSKFEKACAEKNIDPESLSASLPSPISYRVEGGPGKQSTVLNHGGHANDINTLKQAATLIILFTTGMRVRELVELEVGCCYPDPFLEVDGLYRLRVTVKKTSAEYLKGKVIELPVPELTAKAIEVWEKIGDVRRRGNYLISPTHANEKSDHVSGPVTGETIRNFLKRFSGFCEIDYEPHPHQFRKTIAGWFVMNSPVLGPLLLMRLFSHSSLAMTEKYLKNNPLIQEARQEMLTEQSLKIVQSIRQSAQDGKLAGAVGEKIANNLMSDPIFEGLTGDDLGATLEEYLRERAKTGDLHFLLTPLAVCAFDPDDDDEKPCVKKLDQAMNPGEAAARKEALGNMPVTNKCVGVDCDHCVVTECQSDKIAQSLTFYRSLLNDSIKEDYAQNLHLIGEAREFVDKYESVLEQIS